jgi:hypothetical protein
LQAHEYQKKASVIVDGMGCSGRWKTTVATKHNIHSTSLQDILLTYCTAETKKQPIEPQASNSSSRASRWVATPLTHEHHAHYNNKDKPWVNCRHEEHCITSQARGLLSAAAVVGGSLDCAGGHGGVGTIVVVVVVVMVLM